MQEIKGRGMKEEGNVGEESRGKWNLKEVKNEETGITKKGEEEGMTRRDK